MSLPDNWELPEIFRQRLGHDVGRQRIMESEGHLLVILHDPPNPKDVSRKGRFFWRKPDGSWESTTRGNGIRALHQHIQDYEKAIDQCESLERKAEGAKEFFVVLQQVTPLKRTIRNMSAALQEARKAVPMDRELIDIRDDAVNLERAAELLNADAKNGMDFAMAREAEMQNEISNRMAMSAHKLNLFAAFFFPIATLCAIFGTNFTTGIEGKYAPWSLVAVLSVGILLGIGLTIFVVFARDKSVSESSKAGSNVPSQKS